MLYFEKCQAARISKMIVDGQSFRAKRVCGNCGYSLLGVSRWKVGDRVQATCPECGELSVIDKRDVRILEMLEAAEAPGESTPSPPSTP